MLRQLQAFSIRRLAGLDDGQDLLEYAMLASLIAIAALAAVRFVGDTVSAVLWGGIANAF